MTTSTAVFPRLESWKLAVQGWSRDGSLTRAAQEALNLDEVPTALQRLIAQWSDGQWDELTPIELLSGEAMPGAAGAYAISTGTIYLNQSWLESASPQQVRAVLTEERGHHLDGLLSAVDTPGDEGEALAKLLQGGCVLEQVHKKDNVQKQTRPNLNTTKALFIAAKPPPGSKTAIANLCNKETPRGGGKFANKIGVTAIAAPKDSPSARHLEKFGNLKRHLKQKTISSFSPLCSMHCAVVNIFSVKRNLLLDLP